eukprot:gene3938-4305_t
MTISALPPSAVVALRTSGPLFFLGLQACSLQTAWQILNARTVGGFSLLPFISLLVNCVIWTLYGILKKDNTVFFPNALGILVGLFGTSIYTTYSGAKDGLNTFFIIAAIVLSAAGVAYMINDAGMLGGMGCFLAIVLMGSPLATLRTVVRDRSTASLPFGISLMTWGNALCWTLYGFLVADDIMLYGPNSVGLLLASIQMALFAIYGFPAQKCVTTEHAKDEIF